MNAEERLRKKIARVEEKTSILENMIEEKTRELYLAEQELKRQNSFLVSVDVEPPERDESHIKTTEDLKNER